MSNNGGIVGPDQAQPTAWDFFRDAYAARKLLVAVPIAIAIIAAVITLLIPNEYTASARVLPPETTGTTSLLSSLGRGLPGAASLLGGGRMEYSRYLAILSSRSLVDETIERFDLVNAYKVSKARHPIQAARDQFYKNVAFGIDREYRFLTVSVTDTDRERAAEMANFVVEELNRRNAALASQNASMFRQFVEKRYIENRTSLDSLKNSVMRFQQSYGVFDIEGQSRAFMEQTARLRAAAIELEIRYETLRQEYGPENALVLAARNAWQSANRQYENAFSGRERALPVAQASMPALIREYMDLEQERLIQTNILEVIAPLYEQARFDEERETQAVQVVDYAIPPARKSGPKRTIIVVMSFLSAFMMTIVYVCGQTVWRWKAPTVVHAMKQVSRKREAAPGTVV
jgi:tyrosine-protein kinase Etk/Wzc